MGDEHEAPRARGEAPRRRRGDRDAPRSPRAGAVARRRSRGPRRARLHGGEALARSLACFGRHGLVLCLFAFVLFLPLALYQVHCARTVWEHIGGGAPAVSGFFARVGKEAGWLGTTLQNALAFVLQAVVALAVFQTLSGQRVRYLRSLSRGAASLVSVAGVALILACLLFGIGFLGGLLLFAVFSVVGAGLLGFWIFVISLLFLMALVLCVFFVAVQAVVVERTGPAKGMSRSAWLTYGARWKILAIVLTVYVLAFFVKLLVQGGGDYRPLSFSDVRTRVLILVAVDAIASTFLAVCAAVVYHDLRKDKEGVGIEELLRVFA